MRHFRPDELMRFIESLDTHVSGPRRLVLIDAAAASLAYGVTRVTTDIGTISDITDLEEALRLARLKPIVSTLSCPMLLEERSLPLLPSRLPPGFSTGVRDPID